LVITRGTREVGSLPRRRDARGEQQQGKGDKNKKSNHITLEKPERSKKKGGRTLGLRKRKRRNARGKWAGKKTEANSGPHLYLDKKNGGNISAEIRRRVLIIEKKNFVD